MVKNSAEVKLRNYDFIRLTKKNWKFLLFKRTIRFKQTKCPALKGSKCFQLPRNLIYMVFVVSFNMLIFG
jgi:hypothetical protein